MLVKICGKTIGFNSFRHFHYLNTSGMAGYSVKPDIQPFPTFAPGVAEKTSSDESTLCRGSGGTFSSDDGDIGANSSFLHFETEIISLGNTSSSTVQLVKSVKLCSKPPSSDERDPSRGVEVKQESVLLVLRAPKFRY